jgi:hypothetical protein
MLEKNTDNCGEIRIFEMRIAMRIAMSITMSIAKIKTRFQIECGEIDS